MLILKAKQDFYTGPNKYKHAIIKDNVYTVSSMSNGQVFVNLPNGAKFGWSKLTPDNWEVLGPFIMHPIIEICLN